MNVKNRNIRMAEDSEKIIKNTLYDKGSLRFKELVKITGLSEPTISKWLPRLEEEHKIMRTFIKGKKGVFYELTDFSYKRGRKFVELAHQNLEKRLNGTIDEFEKAGYLKRGPQGEILLSKDPIILAEVGEKYLETNSRFFGDYLLLIGMHLDDFLDDKMDIFYLLTNVLGLISSQVDLYKETGFFKNYNVPGLDWEKIKKEFPKPKP
ncbi:hypothetical protein GOV14_04210 [Candidatus Pacearchaeota archaeon]|nr:hypothetical protein [Candidatus Pacearchaeota archaeon]